MNISTSFKLLIAAAVAAAGYWAGVKHTDDAWKAKFTDAASASQQAASTQATTSANISALVDKQQVASTITIDTIAAKVSGRIAANEPKAAIKQCEPDETKATARPELDQAVNDVVAPWRFDTATVRLLNEARLGLSVEPSSFGHGQGGDEPSTVGIGEFAENDLQVVERYQHLKIKHDALVDWVNQLKEQNLGLCVASEPLYPPTLEDP